MSHACVIIKEKKKKISDVEKYLMFVGNLVFGVFQDFLSTSHTRLQIQITTYVVEEWVNWEKEENRTVEDRNISRNIVESFRTVFDRWLTLSIIQNVTCAKYSIYHILRWIFRKHKRNFTRKRSRLWLWIMYYPTCCIRFNAWE